MVLLGAALLGSAAAQTDPGEHSAHHPGEPAAGEPGPTGAGGGAAIASPSMAPSDPAAAGCGGMMGCMGAGPRPFYASLMNMPVLTPEARRFIEAEAERRIGWGSQAISSGQAQLQHALTMNDPAAVQQATAGVRDGLLQLVSGTAALQAINEGQPPRQIALTWFKAQMSVPTANTMVTNYGPWGLSWFHLTTMAFLVAFLLGALLIHYARLRRIGGLVERLAPAAVGALPPVAAASAAPAKTPAAADPAAPGEKPASAATPGQDGAPTRPWAGKLRVVAIFDETPTVKTFRLTGLTCGPIPFTFLPGQFLTFSAEIDGKLIRRSYTIASSPTQREYVEITVKREEDGLESRYLHDHVAVGDPLEVSGPSGNFTFTGTEADSIVLISGGVGITPMMCVLRYLTDRSFDGEIFFLHGARTAQAFIFREELGYLEKRHEKLHLAVTMEKTEESSWTGAVGRISKEFIAQAVPDIARRRVHVCGPPAMMTAVKAALLELGVAKEKIKTEAFGPAIGAVPAAAPTAAPASQAADPPAASIVPSAQAEIQFSKSGKTGPLAPDQSVLEAAEAIGVEIDFSCRVGTCGICVVPLLKGAVTMEVEEGLPPADKARGIILACQAKSASALVVDA